ncbi:MAG: urate hydroxylase PuuD, partial [Aestuariibacter sp.]|nr:urate hydroxylase PuuD [Aestuariibacter sp.]
YQSQKFLAGPIGEPLSEHLHWSKWEAYSTWLSGMGLLAIIYWFGANTYLIDAQVMPLTPLVAIAISIGFIVGGWLIYNTLCSVLKGKDTLLAAIIFIFVMLSDWLLFQLFSARAAYLHVGAMMGSIMVANVFFHIIPGQKSMVAEIRAGQTPDPKYGVIGKQRSVHNTYFTLPVLFIMISNHYPMTYSHEQGWLVLGFIMMAGVLIRQFFVMRHGGNANKALPVAGVVLLLAMVVYLKPTVPDVDQSVEISDAQIQQVVNDRCVVCHAVKPTQAGFASPPLGLALETGEQIKLNVVKIATTVQSRYMPLGNLTHMTDEERALIAVWSVQASSAQ